MARKALIVWGGWSGHQPKEVAAIFDRVLREDGFDVDVADSLDAFKSPARMDGLLLLVRTAQVDGEVGSGDFLLDPLGRLRRPKEREVAPYIFAGVQVLSPTLFAGAPTGRFSLNRLYDRAIAAGRLYALVHDGVWFHLSTPPDLERAEAAMQAGLAKAPF